MQEKLYCYLCGMEDPVENSPLCGDCKEHLPADTQLEDWLDPTIVAAFLKDSDTKKEEPKKTDTKKGNTYTDSKEWQSYYQGGTTSGYRQPCPHPGTKELFSIGKRRFAAANSGGISTGEKYAAAVIDCAGVASKTRNLFVDGTDKYKALNDLGERDLIRLHWTDMGVPPVGRAFWRRLTRMLPEGRIVACCIGGHGRTGTCLASILVANDKMCADEAIDFIRDNHCDRAIETIGQENYIRSLQTEHQRTLNEEYLAQFETEDETDDDTTLDERPEVTQVEECRFCENDGEDCPVCDTLVDIGPADGPCEFCNGDPCTLSTTGCYIVNCCEECGLLDCPEICPNYDDGTRAPASFRIIPTDEEE